MTKLDVRLIVRVTDDRSFGDPYLHLATEVVYRDWEDGGRWVTCSGYSTPQNLRGYDKLGVVAQADHYKPTFYGYRIAYSDIHRAELDDVKRMATTMTRVQRKLDRMVEAFDYPASAADMVLRFAKAIGADLVGFYDKSSPSQDEFGYVWVTASGVKYRIGKAEQEFAKKYDIQTTQED